MRMAILFLLTLALAGGTVSCGGGGGEEVPTPTQPGTLRALALEGAVAPDGGGVFDAFITSTPMDVEAGGLGIFVAETSVLGEVAYLALADGSLMAVFAEGDAAPDLVAGTLSGIQRVWVNVDGDVMALVSIAGGSGGVTQGLLLAQVDVDLAVVTGTEAILYDGDLLAGASGAVTEVDPDSSYLLDTGDVFFRAVTTGSTGFWRFDATADSIEKQVASGDPLGSTVAITIHTCCVSDTGARFAFVAERSDGDEPDGLYVGNVGSGLLYELMVEGQNLYDLVDVASIPHDQPLVVYEGEGLISTVLYKIVTNTSEDHLVMSATDNTDFPIVQEGWAALSPPNGPGGNFGPVDWVNNALSARAPAFQAVMESAGGVTLALWWLEAYDFQTLQPVWRLAIYNGQPSPLTGESFSTLFPGMREDGLIDVANDASIAFANVLTPSGDTGLFWGVASLGRIFATAAPGEDIPGGGDTFAGGNTYRSTTADDVVLFRAPLGSGDTGIFRQGP